jgi:tRNA(adenine34) deaminase
MHWTQLQRLVYGASDVQRGYTLVKSPLLHPRTEVTSGLKAEECKQLLDAFFKTIRE